MEFQRRIGHGRLSEIFGAADAAAGSLPPHGRLRPRGAVSAWEHLPADVRDADQRLRRRRQRVHREPPRTASAAGVHAPPLRARAVDRPRRARVGQDDGVGPERELLARAAAPRHRGAASAPRRPARAAAAVSGRRPEHRRRSRPLAPAGADTRAAAARGRAEAATVGRWPPPRSPPRASRATRPSATSCWAELAAKRSARTTGSWTARCTASGKPLLANDPHLGAQRAVALVSRAHDGRRLRRDRRDAAGRAGGRHRPQPPHRVGRDQRRRRRRRISIASDSMPPARTPSSGAAQEPLTHRHARRSRSRARHRCTIDVRITRHGPLVSDAINANNAASDARAEAARRSSRWRSAGRRSTRRTRRSRRSSS